MSSEGGIVFLCLLLFACTNCNDVLIKHTDFVRKVINYDKVIAPLADSADGAIVALKLLDASTKFPSGVLAGNFFDLGHFDECYSIEFDGRYGKYCLGTIPITPSFANFLEIPLPNATFPRPVRFKVLPEARLPATELQYIGFHFAACVLSDVSASNISLFDLFKEELCYSKAKEQGLSDGAIATIVLLAVVWAIICASTIFEIVCYYREKETPHELLTAFSALNNSRKIFKSTTNPDQLLCLNGIKAISMVWVILGHEYSQMMNAPIGNMFKPQDMEHDPGDMFLFAASVSVDTFFVVGGLVTVYTFLRSVRKDHKFNIAIFYLHRYLRLTPALAVSCLVHLFLINYMGNGPVWGVVDITMVKQCERSWWKTLLYITNYFEDGTCAAPSWYLSVDMQLYIVSPIVLILLWKWTKVGLGLLGCLTVLGSVVPFCVLYFNDISSTFINLDYQQTYYIQPYTRFGPYVIGMILGYVIYKLKFDGLNFKLKLNQVLVLWVLLLTGMVACVYAGFPLTDNNSEPDLWGHSLYESLNRNAWAVVVAGMIWLCVAGHGGPINTLLSLPIFQIITKLSYSMYLLHFAILTIRNSRYKYPVTFSNFDVMHAFWGDFMWTLVFSFLLCISFESPIIVLEKHLFGLGKSAKTAPAKTAQQA